MPDIKSMKPPVVDGYPTPKGHRAIICRVLQHKSGHSAAEIKIICGEYGLPAKNLHSWPSLSIIAARFGYKLDWDKKGTEAVRYYFTPLAPKAAQAARKPASTPRKPIAKRAVKPAPMTMEEMAARTNRRIAETVAGGSKPSGTVANDNPVTPAGAAAARMTNGNGRKVAAAPAKAAKAKTARKRGRKPGRKPGDGASTRKLAC